MCFKEFVETLKLENFQPLELFENTDNHPNSEPDCKLWTNIVPTILIVQKLRRHTGVPIYLASIYRNEAYNKKEGGARRSLHQAFAALDIRIDAIYKGEVTLRDLYDILLTWRMKGKWFKSPIPICTHPVELSDCEKTPHENLQVCEMNGVFKFKFMGGLGYYEKKKYIHIDTRGYNAELTPNVRLRTLT